MTSFLFVFGRTPLLARAELQAIAPCSIVPVSLSTVLVEDDISDRTQTLIDVLAGTVKIAEVLGSVSALEATQLGKFIETEDPDVTFGISCYDSQKLPRGLLLDIKKFLGTRGVRARFVTPKEGLSLSSVVVAKEHVYELVLVPRGTDFLVGKTVAVQPFEEWNKRDYGRPHRETKIGMLPPKVARMAVNIAIGERKEAVIVDPFCGMGTILGEAALRGCRVIGSDQSQKVVEYARDNMRWLATQYPVLSSLHTTFFASDAVHISRHIEKESVDAIVTEPFMGTTRLGDAQSHIELETVKNIIRGLEKLYIGCLKDWQKILKSKGKIVIALPEYAIGGRVFFVKNVIDMCEKLGYTILQGPIEYSRPQAVVRREFFVLQKQ